MYLIDETRGRHPKKKSISLRGLGNRRSFGRWRNKGDGVLVDFVLDRWVAWLHPGSFVYVVFVSIFLVAIATIRRMEKGTKTKL